MLSLSKVQLQKQRQMPGKGKQKAPAKKAKMYWKNPTHFHKFGTVKGIVTPDQEEEWNKVTPEASKLSNYVLDYDPIAKRLEEAKKKMRKRAGLPDK